MKVRERAEATREDSNREWPTLVLVWQFVSFVGLGLKMGI